MNTTVITTPTEAPPPAVTPTPSNDPLKDSLFKSLRLTVIGEDVHPLNAPAPDSGVEVPSTIPDFSQRSGSIADVLKDIENKSAATPPVTPPPTTPAVTTTEPAKPVATTPTTTAVTPPVEPPKPPIEQRRIEVPQPQKPILDNTVLPPPPSHNYDLNSLDDDERGEVENAIFAEQRHPQKYNGLSKQVYEFIKKHKEFVKQQEAENPDVSFDNDNAAYQRFLQSNRPTITSGERKRLERERLLEEAATYAEKKVAGQSKKLEEEIIRLKAQPLVEKTMNDFKSIVKDVMPKDDDPLTEEVTSDFTNKAVTAGNEFLLLSSSLKKYDSTNDTHRWLADFLKEQADLYLKSGHTSLKRGTRTFVPRHEYNAMPSDQMGKHFTFSDEEVLQLLAVNAKAAAEYTVGRERERLKKAGYTRNTPAPATPASASTPNPSVQLEAPISPKASTSVAPVTQLTEVKQSDPFLRFIGR